MTIEQKTATIEQRVKNVFNKILDIAPEEIKTDDQLNQTLGIDSTEMVEISVGLKKEFGIQLLDNELKKTHTLNEIISIIKSKGVNP